jgi:hypothetical protein
MKGRTNVFIAITLLAMLAQMGMTANSFPGFHGNGDCALCHNEPVSAYHENYSSSAITLDGLKTEAFWDETYGRRAMVPVASTFGGVHEFITVIFAQNSSHLFVSFSWADPTSTGNSLERNGAADGVALIWNVNGDNFNDAYFSGMKHNGGDGSLADSWVWKAGSTMAMNSTSAGKIYDNAFDDRGWVDDDATQDVKAFAKYGYIESHAEQNYFVEMVRPLETSDSYDIQFDETGYYTFAIAVFNDTSGIGHYMGFTHEVYVYNGEPVTETTVVTETESVTNTVNITETKSDTPVQLGAFMISIFAISVIVIRKRK